MKISWKHEHTELDANSSIEKKIEVFRERVWGWQLHVADLAINGGKNHDETADVQSLPHSGFTVLQILLSYFEMIARYETGNNGKDDSRELFVRGIQSVFPVVSTLPYAATRTFLNQFYSNARCGLYHMSMTGSGISIAPTGTPIAFADNPPHIVIDPHELAPAMKTHFAAYISRLNDPAEAELRKNFEKRFNHDYKARNA